MLQFMSKSVLLMFCPYVFGHTFRSLIHFKFIFVYDVRVYSNFILFIYLSRFPTVLIEEAVFFPLCILVSFAMIR